MCGRSTARLLVGVVVLSLCAALPLLPLVAGGVSPVVVRGRHLIDSATQQRFFVKGSGYDYDVSNGNAKHWRPALNALLNAAPHINTIRLYEVDPTLQYDDFMTDMNRCGIYVIVPLTPAKGCTMNRDGTPPLTAQPSCYPSCLLSHAQHTINLFHPHPNLLLFAVGNEILNSGARWAAGGCVKAFVRDVKRFMARCEAEERSRRVPVLYAAADNAMRGFTAEENDRLKSDYLTCGDDDDARIDVMGINLFRYCSDTCTFHSCESNKVTAAFSTATLPVLLTEYGCGEFTYHLNHTQQAGVNPFTETALLLSPLMSRTFSGGCAYTYGVRGGESFAFFEGGGRSVGGEAGLVKRCGYPDGLCRVDAYETQLAGAEDRERERAEKRRRARLAGEAESELDEDDGAGEGDEGAAPACPVLLGVDLTMADSRQGADGYEEVGCQAGVGKSATDEERRERQATDREQQTADQAAEERRKRKLAEQQEDGGDDDEGDADKPVVHPQQPAEADEATASPHEQRNTSHQQPSTPVRPVRHADEQTSEDERSEKAGEHSSAATVRFISLWWQMLASACILANF